uniref:Uncharacterized protein n=1 Tax=Lactuca sativa TaxID=4236 RepID=A0A9R1UF53_LACSA|nr:hypothetical protein LSAT_V11C900501450 [Lactuca sativa]
MWNCEESCWLLHNYPLTFIKRRKPIVPPPDIVIEGLENGSFLFDEPLKNFEGYEGYVGSKNGSFTRFWVCNLIREMAWLWVSYIGLALSNPSCALDVEKVLETRIDATIRLRKSLGLPSANTNAYRLVNSEGNRLLGLIVDVIGDLVVIVSSAAWVEKYKQHIKKMSTKNGMPISNSSVFLFRGWFGKVPLEASGDFRIEPEEGEYHLMCQVPSVEINARYFSYSCFEIEQGSKHSYCLSGKTGAGCCKYKSGRNRYEQQAAGHIVFSPAGSQRGQITNTNFFQTREDLEFNWVIEGDGCKLDSGTLSLPTLEFNCVIEVWWYCEVDQTTVLVLVRALARF